MTHYFFRTFKWVACIMLCGLLIISASGCRDDNPGEKKSDSDSSDSSTPLGTDSSTASAPDTATNTSTPDITDTDSIPDLTLHPLGACMSATLNQKCMAIDEAGIVLARDSGGLNVQIPVTPITGTTAASMQIWLQSSDGETIGNAQTAVTSTAAQTVTLTIADIPAEMTMTDIADARMTYRTQCDGGTYTGSIAAFGSVSQTKGVFRCPATMLAGTSNGAKLYLSDPATQTPKEGVNVTLRLVNDDAENGFETVIFTGASDDTGTVNAAFDIPDDTPASARIVAEFDDGETLQALTQNVQVVRSQSILLTTDKPLYQPGQTMHLRALAFKKADMTPLASEDALFEILDSKGNKVFKETQLISEFGIAATTFKLATEVLMGTYTIQVTIGDTVSEKTVTVDKYTLPKFDIAIETEKAFYRPGDTVRGTINTQYFFGEPVAGAKVAIEGQKFDVGFEVFQSLQGTTDAEGLFDFELVLPSFFVGQPLDQGDAFALFHVEVTDTANQKRAIEFTRPVTQSSVLVQVIPETGDVVPGIDNVFYVVFSDPNGKPVNVPSSVTVNSGAPVVLDGSDYGIASFNTMVPADQNVAIEVVVEDETGTGSSHDFSFNTSGTNAFVLVRTDKPLYAVGETATANIFCPDNENALIAFEDRVYLDFVKEGRVINMTTVDLENGVGTYSFEITPEMVGGFEIEAYYLNTDTNIIRDTKLVYVDPANQLNIEISQDKEYYAPAEEANISFVVTDADGTPVQSAIGLQVVDEAVYALMDFRPGIEKVFYELESEIMKPRYEIHGFEMSDVTTYDVGIAEEQRLLSAEVLFAASGSAISSIAQNNLAPQITAAEQGAQTLFNTMIGQINEILPELCDAGYHTAAEVRQHITDNQACWLDPWGTPMTTSDSGDTYAILIASAGPDELWDSADDLSSNLYYYNCEEDGWREYADADADGDWDGDWNLAMDDMEMDTASAVAPEEAGGGGGGPRVRSYFPETLYVNPALITNESGYAELPLTMADSITTWRMSALASSKFGQLGSTEHGITVFQDFFVDIDMPRTLTQDDEISLPVAVYNYLDVEQSVTLTVEDGDWFDLLDTNNKVVVLQPGEVTGVQFTIQVNAIGWQSFTVTGHGTSLSDAVARRVEVLPNGREIVNVESGSISDDITSTFTIPTEAIDNASKIMVKILPGMMAQAVEGLDSMLRMPNGCFEQTSSATYPNVLVLDYMLETGQVTPEIELKAREYISQGYQRLLTFEVDGGGFEWFGQTPAHNILTAYGLMEFSDMSKVHPVDPAVISRTQTWLLAQRQADGHFEPTQGGIAEGAINAYEDDVARTTAYLTYALAQSGYTGSELDGSINWLKANLGNFTDGYGLAMLANAMVAYNPADPVTQQVLGTLVDSRTEDGDLVFWTGAGESTTYGTGDVMTTEATALALYALMRADSNPGLWDGAMNFLIGQKDSMGNFHTTQATILTLRTMLESLRKAASPGPADINILLNGALQQTLSITAADSDVLRLVDLGDVTVEGDNEVTLEFTGDSAYMYQIISRYYVPWGDGEGAPGSGPLAIDVAYDKTDLAVNETVNVTVTVTNTEPDTMAKMVLVDVGIPPGFDVITDDLKAAVDGRILQRFEKTERQLILYVEAISAGAPLVVDYQLRAKYPLVASTGAAEVHPYYEPEKSSEDAPIELMVLE